MKYCGKPVVLRPTPRTLKAQRNSTAALAKFAFLLLIIDILFIRKEAYRNFMGRDAHDNRSACKNIDERSGGSEKISSKRYFRRNCSVKSYKKLS
jgi:hypothetical protein